MPGKRLAPSSAFRWLLLAACLVTCAPALRAQCFGTVQFPGTIITPDGTGVPTTISTVSFAGDRAAVDLIAGRTYRFTSSVATDHITVSTATTSGDLAFGTQPLTFTATASQTHFVHFHTNAACGTQNTARTTRVQRIQCTAGATTCGGTDESILRVIAGGINNFSNGCGGGGYSDFSQLATTALTGQALPITVINGNAFAGDQVHVFADWDRNFTLNDAGEEFILSTTDNLTFTGTITPPPGTAEGFVRLRVRLTFTGAVLPCGTTQFGEVEDYSLYVAAPIPANSIYQGSAGRGDIAASSVPSAQPITRFAGGSGRGDVAAGLSITPAGPVHFGGGAGRGDITAGLTLTPIFNGGAGRGDVFGAVSIAPTPTVNASGGSGRGDIAASAPPIPPATVHFSGGDGRGDIAASAPLAPVVAVHFGGGSGRGDIAASVLPGSTAVLVALRGMLEGPYVPATGLMSDALRAQPAFPLTEPYTALGYAHTGGGGGETIAPAVLLITGTDAIVDWVLLELRDPNDPAVVMASRSALLQRDGDVVDTDGISPVTVAISTGSYAIALRHRNHLGAMTATPVGLDNTPTVIDLTQAGTPTFGINARKTIGGVVPMETLWAGDVTFNGEIKYTGTDNDRDPILQAIGGVVPTNSVSGYLPTDVNLDGTVKYTGTDNDRDPILQNIGGVVPTNTRVEQLP